MARYRNSFHNPHSTQYGPEYYETDAKPIEFMGVQIYERLKGICWDVVVDGVCVANRAGLNGAEKAAVQIAHRLASAA